MDSQPRSKNTTQRANLYIYWKKNLLGSGRSVQGSSVLTMNILSVLTLALGVRVFCPLEEAEVRKGLTSPGVTP